MATDLSERTAVIEEKLDVLHAKHDMLQAKHDAVSQKLDDLHASLTKYKGFIGGVVFVITALWYVLSTFKEWVIAQLR